MHEEGRPVLVGTTSIEKSELIDELLAKPQKMGKYLLAKIGKAVELMKRQNLSGSSIRSAQENF